jgi:energy-coupling factor transporter ATP-binding protein EcfA2
VRLAFAVAVNVDPDILVIDEAMAVGDLRFQKKCKEKIEDKKKAGVTIILVSHSMADIRTACDSVIYLEHGKPKYIGDANEAISSYYYDINSLDVSKLDFNNMPSDHVGDFGGTGDVIISNVRCYQKNKSNNCSDIEYGENIVVELNYNALSRIEKPIIRVNLSVVGYKYFANIDSTESIEIDYIHGKGTVTLEINKPNLYPQTYSVNIGVVGANTNIKYFYWSDAAKFIITSPPHEHLVHPTSIVKLNGHMKLIRSNEIE